MTLRFAALSLSLLLFVCLNCSGSPQTSSQGKTSSASSQTPAIRVNSSLVLVDVLVQDKKTGEPVKDLQAENFLLEEDGKQVSISSFNRGKDQNLRPIQLWFVLVCNEVLHYEVGARRRTQFEATEAWGSRFLAGKSAELRLAMEHLRPDESMGVAHWCDNGESEIDLRPMLDRDTPLNAIEEVATRKTAKIDLRNEDSQERVLRMINDVARTAFPVPLTAIVFIRQKESEPGSGKQEDTSSGLMEFSSLDFGLDGRNESSGAAGSSLYSIQSNEYGRRLGTFIDILHGRYEISFLPGKQGKKLHHVSVALTKDAKERFPDALLRYRGAYSDAPQVEEAKTAKRLAAWKQLDSKMQSAVKAVPNLNQLAFSATLAFDRTGNTQQFVVKIAPNELTWRMLPNGDRRSVVTAVVATYSVKGQPIEVAVKDLEIIQEFDRLPALKDKPVVFSLNAAVEKGAARIRLVVRDVATGHIGSQDLQPAAESVGKKTS
jgi:hypothetical protein